MIKMPSNSWRPDTVNTTEKVNTEWDQFVADNPSYFNVGDPQFQKVFNILYVTVDSAVFTSEGLAALERN